MSHKFYKIRCKHLGEVANKIHELFGPDAVVVGTQEVPETGFWGWLGYTTYEVTVSVPDPQTTPERAKTLAEKRYSAHSQTTTEAPTSHSDQQKKVEEFEKIIESAQKRIFQHPREDNSQKPLEETINKPSFATTRETPLVPFPKQTKATPTAQNDELAHTLREIRELLQVMAIEHHATHIPQEILPIYQDLLRQGMSKELSAELIHRVTQNMSPEHVRDPQIVLEKLSLELRKRIVTTGGIPVCSGISRWVVFCGPTGVGKTTSLAKISAHYAIHEKVRLALATTDTYRVGATEQLKIYAQIIGVPLKVITDKKTALETVQEYSQYDLVFLDTAGNSPYNTHKIRELHEILSVIKPYETILVLDAHTSLEDLRYTLAGFSPLKPTSYMFTKLDETRRFGPMVNLIVELGLPVCYLTHGQNVPDDFTIATPGGIVQLLIEGRKNRA